MEQVVFKIHNGEVTIKASGFKGGACDAATKAFEDVLGGGGKKTRTGEYYEEAGEPKIKLGGGS
jgi:hypothetical protein